MDLKLIFKVLVNRLRHRFDIPRKEEQELSDENGKFVQ